MEVRRLKSEENQKQEVKADVGVSPYFLFKLCLSGDE